MRQSLLRAASAAICIGLLIGCAGPGPREREAQRLDLYQQAAGEPVESFRFWQMQRWEPLGPDHVAIWTRPGEAYLLSVDRACWGLEFANAIGVTSTAQRVHRRFDSVIFRDQRCRIEQIRPIDTDEFRQLAAR